MLDSFIKVPSSYVTDLCKKTLAAVKEHRAKKRAEFLEARLSQINNSFFHKLFKIRDMTEEELVKKLGAARGFDELYWNCSLPYLWEKNKETAQRLDHATGGTRQDMLLSTTDYRRISIF